TRTLPTGARSYRTLRLSLRNAGAGHRCRGAVETPEQADSQRVDLIRQNYGGKTQIAACCCFRSSDLLMISSICRTNTSGRCNILKKTPFILTVYGDIVLYNQLECLYVASPMFYRGETPYHELPVWDQF
ncbi:MAG: hypothetical protein ACKPKO_14335, partial [Candidatus Fonsibacter sp.]